MFVAKLEQRNVKGGEKVYPLKPLREHRNFSFSISSESFQEIKLDVEWVVKQMYEAFSEFEN